MTFIRKEREESTRNKLIADVKWYYKAFEKLMRTVAPDKVNEINEIQMRYSNSVETKIGNRLLRS